MSDSLEKWIAEARAWANGEGCFNDDPEGEPLLCVYWAQKPFLAKLDRLESLARQHREEVEAAEAALGEALRKDAERYRHLFDCPEPFCYRGEVYDTKAVADAAIDAAMNGANG
jgi:hypothetical protein